jgi:sugar phosphate isomerase/epimerase
MLHSPLSRRDMLRCSAAVLAGATLPTLGRAAEEPFGAFTVAIQTYTFRKFTLEQAVTKLNKLGVKYAEFYRGHIPTTSTAEQLKTVKKLLADHDVTPIAFGVEPFSKKHDENKARFEFAAALGAKHLSADPDPDSFDSLDKLCAEYKISIAIHPHGPAGKGRHRWWNAETILKAVKDHHELIGTCLDTGHLIRMAQLGEPLDPAKEVRTMGARNFGMHLKDHDNKRKTDVLYGKDGGVLDVPDVLKALKEVKFKGYIAIEYEAKENEPTEDVAALLAILKESIKKVG